MLPIQPVRLSPSGPELGTPPQQIGGGALIPGRLWTAQGTGGALANVPSSLGPFLPVPGLDAVPVDMRVGYRYDVEVDTVLFGTGGNFTLTVLGSSDNGVTYTGVGGFGSNLVQAKTGCGRFHNVEVLGKFDHVQVSLSTSDAASADCQYVPALTALKIREYTTYWSELL